MKKTIDQTAELVSLNEELHTEFAIEELEQRLETDPLMFVDFFQQNVMMDESGCVNPGSLIMCGGYNSLYICSNPEALVVPA